MFLGENDVIVLNSHQNSETREEKKHCHWIWQANKHIEYLCALLCKPRIQMSTRSSPVAWFVEQVQHPAAEWNMLQTEGKRQ